MIYGWNYTGKDIPPGIKRKFTERRKLPGMKRGDCAVLKGVCQTVEEQLWMVGTTKRPGREVHVEKRQAADGVWYGVYVYSVPVPREEWYG